MSYNMLLKNIFKNSKLTQKELSEKCNKLGVKVSRNYISELLNNKEKIPNENISRAICKVCGVDERLLVLEGYLEKAPKEIRDFIIYLKSTIGLCSVNLFENKFDKNTINMLKEKLEEEPLSDFIIELLDDKNNTNSPDENTFEISNGNAILNFERPFTLKVSDNSMYPLIKEKDNITLQTKNNYQNGDILAITLLDKKEIVIRQILYLGKQVQLIALNSKYANSFYDKDKIQILGKVNKIITEI